jgi:hypothetical protein
MVPSLAASMPSDSAVSRRADGGLAGRPRSRGRGSRTCATRRCPLDARGGCVACRLHLHASSCGSRQRARFRPQCPRRRRLAWAASCFFRQGRRDGCASAHGTLLGGMRSGDFDRVCHRRDGAPRSRNAHAFRKLRPFSTLGAARAICRSARRVLGPRRRARHLTRGYPPNSAGMQIAFTKSDSGDAHPASTQCPRRLRCSAFRFQAPL